MFEREALIQLATNWEFSYPFCLKLFWRQTAPEEMPVLPLNIVFLLKKNSPVKFQASFWSFTFVLCKIIGNENRIVNKSSESALCIQISAWPLIGVWPWASCLIFLSLSVLTCKVGIMKSGCHNYRTFMSLKGPGVLLNLFKYLLFLSRVCYEWDTRQGAGDTDMIRARFLLLKS